MKLFFQKVLTFFPFGCIINTDKTTEDQPTRRKYNERIHELSKHEHNGTGRRSSSSSSSSMYSSNRSSNGSSNHQDMDLVTIRLPIGKEVKTMGDKFITALYVVVMTVLVVFVGFSLVDKAMVEEVETYSTGYEISHMELSQRNSSIGFISVRNDEESATLTVDKDV